MRSKYFPVFGVLFALFALQVGAAPSHILLVVIDDLGWSDVGFHGAQFHTPNMDKLASEGVILDNYYVQPICTPTRGALLSGMYPIHLGLQRGVIRHSDPYGLPLAITTLPQKLKEAGYSTHIVGKWHLGFFEWAYTPLYRGFDSFYGFYTGSEDHFTHKADGILDLHDNRTPVKNKKGVYSTRLYAEQAQKVILSHNASTPLFLYLSFQSVHGPLQAPEEYVNKYRNIKNIRRRTYAAMVDILDEAIGNVTQTMKQAGLWNDTLLIVTTDNGGSPSVGGYNWPLRGAKGSLWEGGVRGVGFVHGKMLKKTGVKCKELFHVTDWYPTLLHLAGITENFNAETLDGFNIWHSISEGSPSPRTEILHNVDAGQAAIRVGDMKLLINVPIRQWYKPPEVTSSPRIRQRKKDIRRFARLYNITDDPSERKELSKKLPHMVIKLLARVWHYKHSPNFVPAMKTEFKDRNARRVARENGYWGPWRS